MPNQNAEIRYVPAAAMSSELVRLAADLERARYRLFNVLMGNDRAASHIARHLLCELSKGGDYSEMLFAKNGDELKHSLYRFVVACEQQIVDFDCLDTEIEASFEEQPVQKYNFVQLLTPFHIETVRVSPEACQIMYELHFLPAYLIEISERIQNQLGVTASLEPGFKLELQASRNELLSLRQQMITCNTGLVAFVAHKYKTNSLTFEDLMQEGIVGLIKAVDRFDAKRGTSFSTYAVFWIKQAISRLVVKQDKVVALPVGLAEKSSPVFEAMRSSYLRTERWPTLAELKTCCDLSEQEIKAISSYYQSTYMADGGPDEDDGMSMLERMQQQQFIQPLDGLVETDLVSYMAKVIATLPEKQAHILAMRFGLKNHTEMTLQAVADHLHVTRERVRQIQNEALSKLKQQFGFDLMLFLEPTDV